MADYTMAFFLSDHRGNAQNAIYPHKMLVSSVEDMAKVAASDHVCAEYQGNHRGVKNFIRADCLMVDLDNDHSDDPAEWKTLDDVRAAFPNVPFYAVESRNHMKPKDGKEPRQKYHLYFHIQEMTDAEAYKRLKNWAIAAFPYLDTKAADAARFFFGVENPQVQFFPGNIPLDGYLPWSGATPPEDATETVSGELHTGEGRERFALPDVISNGERNDTLHRYAFRLFMLGLDHDEVLFLTERANEHRCAEPLEDSEITTLVNSACKQEFNRREWIDRVESVMAFTETVQEAQASGGVAAGQYQTDVLCLEDMQEKTPEWLVPGYIPRKEITVMAGDGGTGKTFCWTAIAAAISSGNKCFFLNNAFPDGGKREPQKVMYFSSEDSNEAVLRPRLRENGADLKNIITISSTDERFVNITLTSPFLKSLLEMHRPALCIFDPLQSFLPRGVNMISRNDMRGAMGRLHVYGEKYGTSFLIVMHTNKKSDVWGRNRLADSADIWDIARSVLVVGKADEKSTTRYLSQEKSSYGKESQTALFRIDGNTVSFVSFTDKRDRDFVLAAARNSRCAPARDAAAQFILEYLAEHGESPMRDLDDAAAGNLIAAKTMRNAKEWLKAQGKITIRRVAQGFGCGTDWLISLSGHTTT